jgi:ubiquinone/menaquinone biosynthesis C-methylase UbiE/protein tyrosine phosphatase (PTP) superfamily phosphohydrolase (DUF442 family)
MNRLSVKLVFVLCLVSIVCLGRIAQSQDRELRDPEKVNLSSVKEVKLGSSRNVRQIDQLYLGGKLAADGIDALGDKKIDRVISLLSESEIDWDEKQALEASGIEYLHIPVAGVAGLTDETFLKVRKLLKDRSQNTFLHCGSGVRVAATWLPFRVLDQGVGLETALKEAELLGLKAPVVRSKVLSYIQKQQDLQDKKTDKSQAEKNVNPGINDSFTDPELNPQKFVERFEVESREIYTQRENIVAACQLKKGLRIADVGAGTGLFTRLFSEQVGSEGWVYAIDIAPTFIEYINEQAQKSQLENITGVVCTANSITLPPDSVDLVFVCDTYHHFEFPKSTLASIHWALKSGGRLVVIDFERIEGKSRDWIIGHVRAGKQVFRAEIIDAGFSFVEEVAVDGLTENYCLVFKKSE